MSSSKKRRAPKKVARKSKVRKAIRKGKKAIRRRSGTSSGGPRKR
jgi:hypothetical protein